jgi:light-regulated signal transduction histidine kinase (bacteriophytochrome)
MAEALGDNERRRLTAIAEDAERKYIRLHNLLSNFLHNLPALSFIKDEEGRYLYVSKSFADFFQVQVEQILGKTDGQWLPEDIAKQFVENDELVRTTRKPLETIERAPTNGRTAASIVQKFPIWLDALDITERQRSQERISELLADLENLAYSVSHELQEPVNTIKSYQNLLAARYKDRMGDDADMLISRCTEAAQTIDRMVTDLWTFARVSKQRDFEDVDAGDALSTALQRISALIDSKSAEIACGRLPKVHAVEAQLVELFEQIIKNAVQHSGDRPVVKITADRIGDFEEIRIADNGKGVEPMLVRDMFRLFKRSESQRPDAFSAGMGLPICARILQHHGGSIQVESDLQGTSVIIRLPAAVED